MVCHSFLALQELEQLLSQNFISDWTVSAVICLVVLRLYSLLQHPLGFLQNFEFFQTQEDRIELKYQFCHVLNFFKTVFLH